ncbi:MAG: hypothetical protein WCY06_03095 [Flavobacteriaceae bacterium]
MKKFILIFIIFTVSKSYSCTCARGNTVESFMEYEAVFKAKVISENEHYPNSKTPKIITLEITEVFKGNPTKTLMIERGKCHTVAPKLNTEWIIFTSKNDKGIYFLEDCNASFTLEPNKYTQESNQRFNYWSQNIKDKIEVLSLLSKTNDLNFQLPRIISKDNQNLISFLKSLPKEKFINDFGLYIIKFNTDRSVKEIVTLNSLGEEVDSVVEIYYKYRADWQYRDVDKREDDFKDGDSFSVILTKNQLFENLWDKMKKQYK